MKLALWYSLLLPALLLPAVVTQGQTCSNGIAGIDGNGVCCPLACGQCGGSGCSKAGKASGLGSDSCCTSGVMDSGIFCDVSGTAPCIYPSDPVESTCTDGIEGIDGNGEVCCPLACGQCGGSGCSKAGKASGLGSASCCTSGVKASDIYCDVSGTAPCIYTSSPVPAPAQQPAASPVPAPTVVVPPAPPTPNPAPTPVMTIPTSCTSTTRPTFRFAASTGVAGRLYAEGEGCFTLTDLYNWRGVEKDGRTKGPLYMLDDTGNQISAPTVVTKKWLLKAELYITGGGIFYCIGSSEGGDCDELRIQSDGPTAFHEVRGHGGSMYFSHTVVTSWDTVLLKPQETYEGGRSFLNCVSEKLTGETCEGQAKNEMGECRMDIIDSEVGYLGYFDSESYGITWKVRGFCTDLSNQDVFETTNVYGDILNSDIHHNYYGHYTYGHQGGVWNNNKMHDNWQYGFDPHDDSDYLTISNNIVYNNVNHGIIASKRCNNVKIFNNQVYDGGALAAGVFLHRSSDNAEVYDNKIWNMQDAGIALLESFNADIHDNEVDNAKYGIRMSLGSAGNMVYDNKFNNINRYGLYTYEGSDPPDVAGGRPYSNTFENNQITETPGGVKLKQSDGIIVSGNTFTGTTELEFSDAQSTTWSENTLPAGVCVDNVVEDELIPVPASTFITADGLPSTEC